MTYRPVVLAVLDGWGCSDSDYGQRDRRGKTSALERFFSDTVDHAVGLGRGRRPAKGIMGNSESAT